jgi:cation diffusion facilitator CzcD-associated flavoprotein CzcO
MITRKVDIERMDTGEKFSDEADVLVSARGGLNEYLWPEIEGLWSFKGKIVHSAAWDQSYVSCSSDRVQAQISSHLFQHRLYQ